jgi:hypothetical protein
MDAGSIPAWAISSNSNPCLIYQTGITGTIVYKKRRNEMKNQTQTIPAKFDRNTLPAWARNNSAVAARCEKDYAFRCDVFAASTAQMKRTLIKTAERLAQ